MARGKLISAMLIFGTIGIFVRYIPFPSSVLAFCRGSIGALFLIAALWISEKKPDLRAISSRLWILLLSGAAIGINWILLFEAYRYTTVAIATVCYYLSPVFVSLLSALLFRERLTLRRGLCIGGALFGLLLVSGVFSGGQGEQNGIGILLGLGAALFYTAVVLMNKFLRDIPPTESTIVQLLAAAGTVLPYGIAVGDFRSAAEAVAPLSLLLTAVVAFVHTGFAYRLYFDSITTLPGQTIALCSYIDPACAILLSITLLAEPIGVSSLLGAILILVCTLFGELSSHPK